MLSATLGIPDLLMPVSYRHLRGQDQRTALIAVITDLQGMTPGLVGLLQVDLQIPPDMFPGTHPLQFQMGAFSSNTALINTN
jgi:hypothetical protein